MFCKIKGRNSTKTRRYILCAAIEVDCDVSDCTAELLTVYDDMFYVIRLPSGTLAGGVVYPTFGLTIFNNAMSFRSN